ncbi:MAG: TIGR03621 family F420-dependent LLM class oxidoreductase [Chloroflexota bacterium]|nr:TIGR03621 family F420-dependent LLM class oxidoreductase [Chloroflexota bacterium]
MTDATTRRPFRFGIQVRASDSGPEWVEKARRAEVLGYDTLQLADHFPSGYGVFSALAVAAAVTERLRVGTFVIDTDFRHPALLAKEAATLDLLSGGRFELGLGAGWMRSEYEQTGIPFDAAGVRISRLSETIDVIRRLWTESEVTHAGRFSTLSGLTLTPRPATPDGPPILVGGGGPKVLATAARQADIVAFNPRATPDGSQDRQDMTAAAADRKRDWIREAAGDRFEALELNIVVIRVIPTADRDREATRLGEEFGLTTVETLESPHFLLGTAEEMAGTLRERRDRYGISYISVTEPALTNFGPVMSLLRGT